jgi:Ca2+-binding EF-hand superfamily protein
MRQSLFKVALFGFPGICCFALSPLVAAHGDGMHKDAQFQMMDSNGDGKISAEEHAAGAKKMFEMMDADKDGKVTAAEMDAAHEKMTGKPKGGDKEGNKMKGDMKGMSAADKIKMIDTNHDGVLSADEHDAGAKMMFDKMDTDHDGFLTKAEMEAGHAKWMGKGKEMSPHDK